MLTLVHASDLQMGRPFRPEVGEAFLAAAAAASPDLVVVSGDLTQRAKTREYRAVREFLDRLPPCPRVVTPGNHDVPLYRFWERIAAPYRNWRRWMAPELDTVLERDGAVVVALNSSAPRRAIINGRLDRRQLIWAARAFADVEQGALRILVTHHHFAPTPHDEGGRPLPGAARLLRAFEDMGVELILGGHIHQTRIGRAGDLIDLPAGDPGALIVRAGTATSSRGRGRERGSNTFNILSVDERRIDVETWAFDRDARAFRPRSRESFGRRMT